MTNAFLNEDWDRAQKRFLAFWSRELVDRCCISVRSPGDKAPPAAPPPEPDNLVKRWLDPEYNLKRMRDQFSRLFFGGEAYPATTMCLGASVMAEFFGAKAEFLPETVWYHPVIQDLPAYPWPVDPTVTPLYRATFEATRYYIEECRGDYFVGIPELGSATDDLSLLRGVQQLVLDMVDQPDAVKSAIARLVTTWQVTHTKLYEMTRRLNAGGCCIHWMQVWAPGPCYQMSCDFSAVLSPQMYRGFIVPEIEAYLDVNPFGVYHLDGPDALKHLDTILSIPRLKAIQWTQGAGQAPKSDPRWLPYYRRIQEAGKCLVLPEVEPYEIERLLGALPSRGLFLWTWAASEAEARDVLGKIHQWTRD